MNIREALSPILDTYKGTLPQPVDEFLEVFGDMPVEAARTMTPKAMGEFVANHPNFDYSNLAITGKHWDNVYSQPSEQLPWDSEEPSPALVDLVEHYIPTSMRGAALDIGCGSGANSVYLAKQGFKVTAFDISAAALRRTEYRARNSRQTVSIMQGDILQSHWQEKFMLVFDKGCLHHIPGLYFSRYTDLLAQITHPGAYYLLICHLATEKIRQQHDSFGVTFFKSFEFLLYGKRESAFTFDEIKQLFVTDLSVTSLETTINPKTGVTKLKGILKRRE